MDLASPAVSGTSVYANGLSTLSLFAQTSGAKIITVMRVVLLLNITYSKAVTFSPIGDLPV